ncbi:MAG: M23 family metallopeptidase [Gammaproteobacteria bacterium]|nr:M23 family metallopeptidase [Gammaproteobacteria bacterium]
MDVVLDGSLIQGGLVRGQVEPGQTVTLDGKAVATTEDGRFVVGFGREHSPLAVLRISDSSSVFERTLAIEAREYQTQHIKGLPKKMVTPNPEDLARIRRDQAEVRAARSVHSTLRGFLESFRWPVAGIITGVYGSRRVLNGEPRNPHYGVDIAAPTGTPVLAPASGQVTLAHPDMYYTGATLILDHGLGVSSTFLHLQDIDVVVGQTVAAGEQIGRVGSSGRSTGPHLDWRMNWLEVRVDPALLVGPMPPPPGEGDAQ